MLKSNEKYWNKFYSNVKSSRELTFPSQFAAFTIGEKNKEDCLIEIGCGTGRDSLFFSNFFNNVYAYDKSSVVIKKNIRKFKNIKNLKFNELDVNNPFNFSKIKKKNKILYARFLLHSLNNKEILKFINLASNLLSKNEKIFLEYRSIYDKTKKKIFSKHYRNFLRSNDIKKMFEKNFFKIDYNVQGKGFAKYKIEDAHVVRQIFVKL